MVKYGVFVFFVMFLSLSFFAGSIDAKEAVQKQITVVFRCDDLSTRSSGNIERKLIETFQKRGKALTFGVIPCVCEDDFHKLNLQQNLLLSDSKIQMLREALKQKVVDISQHGYSHQTIRQDSAGGYSEFDGVKYQEQFQKILKGKEMLEDVLGINIRTFIPPWGMADQDTIQVLEKMGFIGISPIITINISGLSDLKFLPETCTLLDLKEAVSAAREVEDNFPVIVVGFHWNTFFEENPDRGDLSYKSFESILDWVISQKDIEIKTLDNVFSDRGDLGCNRFLEYQKFCGSFGLLPAWLQPSAEKIYFYPDDGYAKYIILFTFLTLFFYLAIIFISGFIIAFILKKLIPSTSIWKKLFIVGTTLLLFFALIYALKNSVIGLKGMITLSIILGMTLGARKG